jgi:hypothetical protein
MKLKTGTPLDKLILAWVKGRNQLCASANAFNSDVAMLACQH